MKLLRTLALFVTSLPLAFTAPAQATGRITPYIEIEQVLDADFNNGGDVLTYTSIAAGVDGSVKTKRVEAQVSYRYERRIPWNNRLTDDNVHSGLARGRAEVVPGLLGIEGGAIALRTRSDIRGDAPAFLNGQDANVTQVYGIYAGPSLHHRVGPIEMSADYRLGYVKAQDSHDLTLPNGQQRLDRFDDATSHAIDLSVGMPSGRLPFGWTATAGYTREDSSQLDQRFTGKYIRDDITWPVGPTLALTGGVGYENIHVSERAPLRDSNGVPVLDRRGRFVTDPASPRLLAYETDGLIWDIGAIWKPNRRTSVEVRGGRRYGGRAITASVEYRLGRETGFRLGVYDAVDSFGRALTRGIAAIPVGFAVDRNPLNNNFSGCVFGTEPGTGGCLDDTLQSIATANYRSRGVFGTLSGARGPWTYGIGGGYANHKYISPRAAGLFSVDGVIDQSFNWQANLSRQLSTVSQISADLIANWYSSGIRGAPDVSNAGAALGYSRNFTDHLVGQASVGLYRSHIQRAGSSTHGQALLGLRYQF